MQEEVLIMPGLQRDAICGQTQGKRVIGKGASLGLVLCSREDEHGGLWSCTALADLTFFLTSCVTVGILLSVLISFFISKVWMMLTVESC